MRGLGAALVAAAVLLTVGERPASAAEAQSAAPHAETCRHYVNRARFMPRTGPVDFVVALAEGCRAARGSLASGEAEERAAAARFLSALSRLRATVIAMNMEMLSGERRAAPGGQTRLRAVRSVSRSGEFLIAHRMGLLRDFDRWRALAPGFSLAFR